MSNLTKAAIRENTAALLTLAMVIHRDNVDDYYITDINEMFDRSNIILREYSNEKT